jgi:hypothetical protein
MTARRVTSKTIDAAWARFRVERAAQLAAWIEAESALAEARRNGADDFDAGDRLLAAEAALQTSIVDFAATLPGQANPSPVALEILRLAEAMLDSARSERVARARALREPAGSPRPVPGRRAQAPRRTAR